MNEITFELTDYCKYDCNYCSSNSVDDISEATFLDTTTILREIVENDYDRIILSGGEPLAHPNFYKILQACKRHADDVIVYTNELTHIGYNPNVIDGIYVEANLTITDDTDEVKVLKRVQQGKEKGRPEVSYSSNWDEDCSCEDRVVRPSGEKTRHPCDKYSEV